MPKIELNLVAAAMKQAHVDPAKLREVLELLNLEANAQGDEEAVPPVKKQYVVLVSDPEGKLQSGALVSWVVQIPEDESVVTTLDRIYRATYDFNASKKGRILPAKSVGDVMECVPAKYLKEVGVWVKTKTPVLVLRSDNKIPRDETLTYTVNGKPIE